jgi:transketolase
MRTAFFRSLFSLAERDPRITLVTGDLGFGVLEPFAERFPSQFLNAGVAEQNMTGLAAGMALSGRIVFTYSIANFPTIRCLEQIRNDVCYHRANVKVVSVGGGYAYGSLGMSHHATEDIALLRALPGMVVVSPADPIEAENATRAVAEHDGPCYLRLGRAGERPAHRKPIDFRLGKALPVRAGGDLTIIATGAILQACLEAAEQLDRIGIGAAVLSMHTIKPLDVEAVLGAAERTQAVLTVEEHSVVGGLGSAVAEVLAQHARRSVAFRILALPDRFCTEVGDQAWQLSASGLTSTAIVQAARELRGAAAPSRLVAQR